MYQKSNYEGWDFKTVWSIEDGKDYPKLKFEKEGIKTVPENLELKIVLEPEEQLKLGLNVKIRAGLNVTWSSSDSGVATVDANGLVKAVSRGTAVVTVQSLDGSYTMNTKVLVVGEELEQYRITVELHAGETLRLTVDEAADLAGNWSVLDTSIATVTEKGRVMAVAAGLTIVTAEDADGNKIGDIYIRVKKE